MNKPIAFTLRVLLVGTVLWLQSSVASAQPDTTKKPPAQRPGWATLVIPDDIEFLPDLQYGLVGTRVLTLDVLKPKAKSSKPRPVLVWFHGGAWRGGNKDGTPPESVGVFRQTPEEVILYRSNVINGQPATYQPGGSVPIFPFVSDPKTINLNDVAGHYNDVARLDGVFGAFIGNLKKQGLYDNSLIIVIGDNGPDFDRAKATCYEAGLRVPMIVKMPGQTTGQTIDELISTLDIFPTIAEALNLPVQKLNLQGIALQQLTGKSAKRRTYSYGEFIYHSDNHLLPTRSVKDKQYKLIVSPLTSFYAEQLAKDPANFSKHPWFPKYAKMPAIQLYDLKADPTEKTNLAGNTKLASVQKRLETAMKNWQRDTADSLFTTAKLKSYEPEIVRILNQPVTPSKGE